MRKYRFSTEQRFALWRVYGRKCFYCGQPILFQEITVDHVLPEHLLDKPEELLKIRMDYGLGSDFSINDYCNWVPSHAHCNREKGTAIYQRTPALIKVLETVKRKAQRAKAEEERIISNLKKGDLLGRLGIALEKGIVAKDEVSRVLHRISARREFYEPIVITFGLNIGEALSSGLEKKDVPLGHAQLCDWLGKDLVNQLSSLLSCSFYYPEPSERTGETLSVRLAFLLLDFNELESFTSPWWEILEIQYYSEVYGEAEWTRQRYKEKLEKAPIIDDREFIELLHRGGLLIGFRQITETDYRAIAISQDYAPYQSDSYYDLRMWKEILELAGLEDWEIEEALAKADRNVV